MKDSVVHLDVFKMLHRLPLLAVNVDLFLLADLDPNLSTVDSRILLWVGPRRSEELLRLPFT